MKYYKLWKEPDAELEEITYEQAVATLEKCYFGDIDKMLSHEQAIPCVFSMIYVKKD